MSLITNEYEELKKEEKKKKKNRNLGKNTIFTIRFSKIVQL